MYCKNCGKEMEEGVGFCPSCGIAVQDTPEVEVTPVTEVAEGEAPQQNSEVTQPAKKSKKLVIMIVAVAVIAALVVAGIFLVPKLFGGSYEDVAKNYALAYAEADMVEASKYSVNDTEKFYEEMIDYSCEEYGITRDDFFEMLTEQYGVEITSVAQLFEVTKTETQEYFLESYGEYTITATVLGSEKIEAEGLASIKEAIVEDQSADYPSVYTDVNADKITAGYNVEVELTISGTEITDTDSETFTVVKYNGKWKVLSD